MRYLLELLRQKSPKADKTMPVYFHRALSITEISLAVYFIVTFILFSLSNHRIEWAPLAACAAILCCRLSMGRVNSRLSFYAFELVIVLWCAWHTYTVGWSYGAQHLLIPMLMLCFFNIYEPMRLKLLAFVLVVAYRIALFDYSLSHPGIYEMSRSVIMIYQIFNTLSLFHILGLNFITFSSGIQESERELILNNQALHREAGTDPLTQLPNRRAMLDEIEAYRKESPEMTFCVAIADIDFFKKVNDTYGHSCGDYTLKALAELFLNASDGKYKVCRWGGEEFCFFLPEMNLDQAGGILHELHIAVRKMPLRFGNVDFSITITIGVEEFDFHSSLDALLDKADQKLYMGKAGGRDRVVF